ncbi:hypothetical protein ACEPPN_002373 [Leptodophora sp. 'Broadleaf-Isolate-01']
MSLVPDAATDLLPPIRDEVKMLLKRIIREILLPNLGIIQAFVIFSMVCITIFYISIIEGRRQGKLALLRSLEGMDEFEILDEIEHLCWMKNVPLGTFHTNDSNRGPYERYGTDSGYEGESDTESEDSDHEENSRSPEDFEESETIFVDYLNTPD